MANERLENLVIFALGVTDELMREGRITGGSVITDTGREHYRALVQSGFDPDQQEVLGVLEMLFEAGAVYDVVVVEE